MTDSHKADASSRADVAAELKQLSLEVKEALRRSSEKISDFWGKLPTDEELIVFGRLSDSAQADALDAILCRFSILRGYANNKGCVLLTLNGVRFLRSEVAAECLQKDVPPQKPNKSVI